ncbi:MAG TPA: hypothetical protein VLJ59_16315 [Mycobacteriales bacterium]|nr:hypothetical protein [Mycobacteriales bacterium]
MTTARAELDDRTWERVRPARGRSRLPLFGGLAVVLLVGGLGIWSGLLWPRLSVVLVGHDVQRGAGRVTVEVDLHNDGWAPMPLRYLLSEPAVGVTAVSVEPAIAGRPAWLAGGPLPGGASRRLGIVFSLDCGAAGGPWTVLITTVNPLGDVPVRLSVDDPTGSLAAAVRTACAGR